VVFVGRHPQQLLAFELGLVLAFIFMSWDFRGRRIDMPTAPNLALAVVSVVSCLYIMEAWPHLTGIATRSFPTFMAKVMLFLPVIVLTIEGTRRVLGMILAVVIVAFLGYDLWGQHINIPF